MSLCNTLCKSVDIPDCTLNIHMIYTQIFGIQLDIWDFL